jgi:hypothetical protein
MDLTLRSSRRRLKAPMRLRKLGAAGILLLTISYPLQSVEAASSCGTSGKHAICLTAPDTSLSGKVTISVTNTPNFGSVTFFWVRDGADPVFLMHDYAPSPQTGDYSFTWPTQKYADSSGLLQARYGPKTNSVVSIPVTLANGGFLASPHDWRNYLPPGSWTEPSDAVVAAVGDGASDEGRSDAVAAHVAASNPDLFLYLGDVYWKGTYTEMLNHYGASSQDGTPGALWGRMAAYTQSTVGNHEAGNSWAWRDYWHHHPLWTSFRFANVLFFDLDSSQSMIMGSPQYDYVQGVLSSPAPPCVVAFWHIPALADKSIGTSKPMWTLLADHGGDLVLNGHLHSMAQYHPLNDQLQLPSAGQATMTELISGAGGRGLGSGFSSDSRLDWSVGGMTGELYVTLKDSAHGGTPNAIDWTFEDVAGNVLHTGHTSC